MYVKADCGCELEVYAWPTSHGCCCGECYDVYAGEVDIDDATIEKPCDLHSK